MSRLKSTTCSAGSRVTRFEGVTVHVLATTSVSTTVRRTVFVGMFEEAPESVSHAKRGVAAPSHQR